MAGIVQRATALYDQLEQLQALALTGASPAFEVLAAIEVELQEVQQLAGQVDDYLFDQFFSLTQNSQEILQQLGDGSIQGRVQTDNLEQLFNAEMQITEVYQRSRSLSQAARETETLIGRAEQILGNPANTFTEEQISLISSTIERGKITLIQRELDTLQSNLPEDPIEKFNALLGLFRQICSVSNGRLGDPKNTEKLTRLKEAVQNMLFELQAAQTVVEAEIEERLALITSLEETLTQNGDTAPIVSELSKKILSFKQKLKSEIAPELPIGVVRFDLNEWDGVTTEQIVAGTRALCCPEEQQALLGTAARLRQQIEEALTTPAQKIRTSTIPTWEPPSVAASTSTQSTTSSSSTSTTTSSSAPRSRPTATTSSSSTSTTQERQALPEATSARAKFYEAVTNKGLDDKSLKKIFDKLSQEDRDLIRKKMRKLSEMQKPIKEKLKGTKDKEKIKNWIKGNAFKEKYRKQLKKATKEAILERFYDLPYTQRDPIKGRMRDLDPANPKPKNNISLLVRFL